MGEPNRLSAMILEASAPARTAAFYRDVVGLNLHQGAHNQADIVGLTQT
jgi:catechol 2,3-dioxygenase-like lactoylglutathione lyase family enzyme